VLRDIVGDNQSTKDATELQENCVATRNNKGTNGLRALRLATRAVDASTGFCIKQLRGLLEDVTKCTRLMLSLSKQAAAGIYRNRSRRVGRQRPQRRSNRCYLRCADQQEQPWRIANRQHLFASRALRVEIVAHPAARVAHSVRCVEANQKGKLRVSLACSQNTAQKKQFLFSFFQFLFDTQL
jgi:hypothetical protein